MDRLTDVTQPDKGKGLLSRVPPPPSGARPGQPAGGKRGGPQVIRLDQPAPRWTSDTEAGPPRDIREPHGCVRNQRLLCGSELCGWWFQGL